MDTVERPVPTENQKFCKFCGAIIDKDCVICPKCGKQVEELKSAQPNVVINNTNTNANVNTIRGMVVRRTNGFHSSFAFSSA